MKQDNFLKAVFGEKVTKSTEIELHLFEYCNLSCSFCGQDHKNKEGMNTIVEKSKQVIDFMKQSEMTDHIVNIMGGEIFNDDIQDHTFKDYLDFCSTISNYVKDTNQKVRFNFVTNLIFSKNIANVEHLLDVVDNSMLSTSYDFAGRGLDINRMLTFKANLTRFKERIGVVGFVLTKPSIRKLLLDKDKYFKEVLYRDYPLYFDWYVPEGSSDKMMPSEQEMLDAFNYIAKLYPKIEPVNAMLTNEFNQMTCYSLNKVTILPSGKEVTCRYLDYKEDDFENPIDYKSNANIIQSHLDRNDCYSCEYYSRCQFRCFVQGDWKGLERLPECFIKTFFQQNL